MKRGRIASEGNDIALKSVPVIFIAKAIISNITIYDVIYFVFSKQELN